MPNWGAPGASPLTGRGGSVISPSGAQAQTHKKELKRPDQFVDFWTRATNAVADYLASHSRALVISLTALATVIGGSVVMTQVSERRAVRAAEALDRVQRIAAVEMAVPGAPTPPSDDGLPRLPTEKAQLEAALKELDASFSPSSRGPLHAEAMLVRGSLLLNLDRAGEAITTYQALLADSLDRRLRFLAQEGLGYGYEHDGKLAEAQGAFAKLGDDAGATEGFYKDRAMYHQARIAELPKQPGGRDADLSRGAGQEPHHLVARGHHQSPRRARDEVTATFLRGDPRRVPAPPPAKDSAGRSPVTSTRLLWRGSLRSPAAPPSRRARPGTPSRPRTPRASSSSPGGPRCTSTACSSPIRRSAPPAFSPTGTWSSARAPATIAGVVPETGHVDWVTGVSGGVDSTARFDSARGQVYVGTDDGSFYAVDPGSGKIRWTYHGKGEFERAPEVGPESASTPPAPATTWWALDPATGKWRWQYEREMPEGFTIHGYAGPRLHGNELLAGFADGYFVALSAGSGEVLWARSLATASEQFIDVDTTPALAGDLAYVSSYSGGLCAVDLKDGAIKWRLGVEGVGDVSIADGRLFFAAPRQGVHAADLQGHVLWRQGLTEAGRPHAPDGRRPLPDLLRQPRRPVRRRPHLGQPARDLQPRPRRLRRPHARRQDPAPLRPLQQRLPLRPRPELTPDSA